MIIKFPMEYPFFSALCDRCKNCQPKLHGRKNEFHCRFGLMGAVCDKWELTDKVLKLRTDESGRLYDAAANG